MKYLISLLFLFSCIACDAKLSFSKTEFIATANEHKKKAHSCLMQANHICVYIPDLKSREHIKEILATSIACLQINDFKGRILTVGLGLIASLANDCYDQYCQMRSYLYEHDYHLEMWEFYNQVSISGSGYKDFRDTGTKAYFNAIDNITLCEVLTKCISDDFYRGMVSKYLNELRDDLLKYIDRPHVPYSVYDRALTFHENMFEIVCEIEEESIRTGLCLYTFACVEDVATALRELEGYDAWPDLDDMWNRTMICIRGVR